MPSNEEASREQSAGLVATVSVPLTLRRGHGGRGVAGRGWRATGLILKVLLVVAMLIPLGGSPGYASSRARGVPVTMFGGTPAVNNITTNWFTKYAENRFGLKFQWDLTADVSTKQPLLLGSGNPPDVIWSGSISQPDALKYGSQHLFVPLNSLIRKYAPNVARAIRTVPGLAQDVTAPGGKIYSLPYYNYCLFCTFAARLWVNVKYLNEFHLNMPQTTAQFEHVLEVFKAHGLVPLTGSPDGWYTELVTPIMNAFIPFDSSGIGDGYINVNDGKATFAPVQKGWRQGLLYLSELYSKGLFTKTALTQQATALDQLITEQKVGVMPSGSIQNEIPDLSSPNSHYLDWLGMPALKGPSGARYAAFAGQNSSEGLTFALTNKSTKQQRIRIMKLVNFMWSPLGQEMANYGPKGKYWRPSKKGAKGLSGGQALYLTNFNPFTGNNQNVGWNQWGPVFESEKWRNGIQGTPPFTAGGDQEDNQLMAEVTMAGHQPREQYPQAVWIPSSELESYDAEQTNIDNYVSQWMEEFITGEKSVRSDWTPYLRGLKSLGLSSYMKISQQVMGKPADAALPQFQRNAGEIKFLVQAGHVPPLIKKYLIQEGVPASDFRS